MPQALGFDALRDTRFKSGSRHHVIISNNTPEATTAEPVVITPTHTIEVIVGDYGNFDNTMTIHMIAAGSSVGDLADALPTKARETPVIVDPLGRKVNQSIILSDRSTYYVKYLQEVEGRDMSSSE